MKKIIQKNKLSFIVAAAAICMGVMTMQPVSASAPGGGGGGTGCYFSTTLECGTFLGLGGGQQSVCNFTGTYGSPYSCTEHPCYGGAPTQRTCVQP